MARHVAARVGEIDPGKVKLVKLAGREIGLFNVNGEYFALANRCPHQGGPMCTGQRTSLFEADQAGEIRVSRRGEILRCPWHGWEFDIRTGESWVDPKRTFIRNYAVSVETGETLTKAAYVADTFKVTVEDEYVVVEV